MSLRLSQTRPVVKHEVKVRKGLQCVIQESEVLVLCRALLAVGKHGRLSFLQTRSTTQMRTDHSCGKGCHYGYVHCTPKSDLTEAKAFDGLKTTTCSPDCRHLQDGMGANERSRLYRKEDVPRPQDGRGPYQHPKRVQRSPVPVGGKGGQQLHLRLFLTGFYI